MAAAQAPNDIILFHYPFSPYARRIVWYLTLRNIPYAQCLQPPILPRPDLSALGVAYRRIPLLSIGNDIYADTRLILSRLEAIFPPSTAHPALSTAATKPLEQLLSAFTIDGGVFARAASLIPTHLPLLKDANFVRDRGDFSGRAGAFSADAMAKGRPESIAHMRRAFDVYETLLADGRGWVAGTEDVSLADIEGVWPLDWMADLGSLPKELFGADRYPKTQAWVARFKTRVKQVKGPKPVTLKGEQVFGLIAGSGRREGGLRVESDDPTGLKEGQEVQFWPIDTGANHKDSGRLVGLTKEEVVIAVKTKKDSSKEVHLHAPRWGFRVAPAGGQAKL